MSGTTGRIEPVERTAARVRTGTVLAALSLLCGLAGLLYSVLLGPAGLVLGGLAHAAAPSRLAKAGIGLGALVTATTLALVLLRAG